MGKAFELRLIRGSLTEPRNSRDGFECRYAGGVRQNLLGPERRTKVLFSLSSSPHRHRHPYLYTSVVQQRVQNAAADDAKSEAFLALSRSCHSPHQSDVSSE